jgi:hypothetical protein
MRKNNFRLAGITPLPPYQLKITYIDNSAITVDLEHLLQSFEVFAPLENATEFESAIITDFGFTVEWSCGASLDADRLFEMGLEQAGMIRQCTF